MGNNASVHDFTACEIINKRSYIYKNSKGHKTKMTKEVSETKLWSKNNANDKEILISKKNCLMLLFARGGFLVA